MRNTVSLFLFCASAVVVSGSRVVRAGVFVALTCDDLGNDRRSVMNATVEAAISPTTGDARSLGSNVEVDVVDACLTEHSVAVLSLALEERSSSYVGIAGPGLYHLCDVVSNLQRNRPVSDENH